MKIPSYMYMLFLSEMYIKYPLCSFYQKFGQFLSLFYTSIYIWYLLVNFFLFQFQPLMNKTHKQNNKNGWCGHLPEVQQTLLSLSTATSVGSSQAQTLIQHLVSPYLHLKPPKKHFIQRHRTKVRIANIFKDMTYGSSIKTSIFRMQTLKKQIILHIDADWSAPSLFALLKD